MSFSSSLTVLLFWSAPKRQKESVMDCIVHQILRTPLSCFVVTGCFLWRCNARVFKKNLRIPPHNYRLWSQNMYTVWIMYELKAGSEQTMTKRWLEYKQNLVPLQALKQCFFLSKTSCAKKTFARLETNLKLLYFANFTTTGLVAACLKCCSAGCFRAGGIFAWNPLLQSVLKQAPVTPRQSHIERDWNLNLQSWHENIYSICLCY